MADPYGERYLRVFEGWVVRRAPCEIGVFSGVRPGILEGMKYVKICMMWKKLKLLAYVPIYCEQICEKLFGLKQVWQSICFL